MASEHETATDYFQAIAQGRTIPSIADFERDQRREQRRQQREHGLMGAPDTTQDRWGTERKVKSLRLSVGENEFFIEGENLTLDAEFFKLIDIWVKAITPVGQEDIDKLTGKLKKNTDALAASVAEHPSESLKEA